MLLLSVEQPVGYPSARVYTALSIIPELTQSTAGLASLLTVDLVWQVGCQLTARASTRRALSSQTVIEYRASGFYDRVSGFDGVFDFVGGYG